MRPPSLNALCIMVGLFHEVSDEWSSGKLRQAPASSSKLKVSEETQDHMGCAKDAGTW
jgi:hypothetical protein